MPTNPELVSLCLLLAPACAMGAAPNCESPKANADIGCAFVESTITNLGLMHYVSATTAQLRSDSVPRKGIMHCNGVWTKAVPGLRNLVCVFDSSWYRGRSRCDEPG